MVFYLNADAQNSVCCWSMLSVRTMWLHQFRSFQWLFCVFADVIHVQRFRSNIDMAKSFDSSGSRWEHPPRTLPLTWCKVNPFLTLRLFESASTVRASFSLGVGNLNVSHISLQDGFLVEHQLRFCIIPSICLRKSRGRGSIAYPPSSKQVRVEGLMRALPDPLIAAGKHRYQGER